MSIKNQAFVAGVFEHPTRRADTIGLASLYGACAKGALDDAGLTLKDVDGLFCAGAPGFGPLSLADYLGVDVRHLDTTELGGAAYVTHVSHAAQAIMAGKCSVALIILAGRPKADGVSMVSGGAQDRSPDAEFEAPFGPNVVNNYAMACMRHMHEFGTTSEQLAWVKVAASHHAQHNPNAVLREVVTVDDVVSSPVIADPLHRLDCCVISDGGGALVVVSPDVMRSLGGKRIRVMGAGEAFKGQAGGNIDLTYTAALRSGAIAFAEAGVTPADVKYASVYDSFTITVLMQLEDLGFCEKGKGGEFVSEGNLISGVGRLPVNTDGGGLCNNHPGNRGGMTKVIEAVRQLRGEAHPAVQVKNCDIALVHGTGGDIGLRHAGSTLLLERD